MWKEKTVISPLSVAAVLMLTVLKKNNYQRPKPYLQFGKEFAQQKNIYVFLGCHSQRRYNESYVRKNPLRFCLLVLSSFKAILYGLATYTAISYCIYMRFGHHLFILCPCSVHQIKRITHKKTFSTQKKLIKKKIPSETLSQNGQTICMNVFMIPQGLTFSHSIMMFARVFVVRHLAGGERCLRDYPFFNRRA